MSGESANGKDPRSPESYVSKGSLSSSSNDRSNGEEHMPLRIEKQPPSHVFSGAWFSIDITSHFHDANGGDISSISSGSSSSPSKRPELIADLHLCDAAGAPQPGPLADVGRPSARLILDPPGPIEIPTIKPSAQDEGRITKIRCQLLSDALKPPLKLEDGTIAETPSKYRIRISLRGGFASEPGLKKIPRIFTDPIQIVTAKLAIEEESQWDSIFYKDEGGRDKCMAVTINLRQHDNSLLKNQKIPLKWTLLYDSDQYLQVMRQETLRVLGPKRQYIDPETAQVVLRFRIDDVSKNHQGQDFRVEVSADPSKYPHIGPACTPAVNVRSKRNKRNKPTPLKLDSMPLSAARTMGPSPHQDSVIPNRQPFPQSHMMSPPMSIAPPAMSPPLPLLDDQRMEGNIDPSRLREAMKGVIRWTEEVVNGLYPLQWQIIGYAQFPDGSIDYNRPFHSMPNPNACISNVLSLYSNETRGHLAVLTSAVENTRTPSGSMSGKSDGNEMFSGGGQYRPPPLQQERAYAGGDHAAKPSPKYPYAEQQSTAASSSYNSMTRASLPGPYGMAKKQRVDANSAAAFGLRSEQHMHPHHTPQHRQQMPRAGSLEDITPTRLMEQSGMQQTHHPQMSDLEDIHEQQTEENFEGEEQQGDVEYILAKQYKSLQTGNVLGFPAYNAAKEILGFYRESSMKVGIGQFIPISRHKDEFGSSELTQATRILEDAIAKKSQAVHAMKDWGSLYSLIDHALVYDWSKDLGESNDDSPPGASPNAFD